ncbi:MAG: response regulator [Anaerolineales bacterium]|nr:response regulator [Anaerolineales bacterium]
MSQTLRILLIDDNPDDRTLATRELKRGFTNIDIVQVADAEGLTQALQEGGFDLVITDYQLRWTDGLTVLRTIKGSWPDCPVVMFTATGSEEVAVEAMKAGLNDYVLKSPKHFPRLTAAVRLALEQAEQRRALKEAETRYRSLFDGVPIGLYRATPTGQLLDANPALVKMLGYPNRDALLAVNLAHLYANPEERQQWLLLMERSGLVQNFEVQMRRLDGTIIWVRNSASAVRDEQNQVLYYEGAVVA